MKYYHTYMYVNLCWWVTQMYNVCASSSSNVNTPSVPVDGECLEWWRGYLHSWPSPAHACTAAASGDAATRSLWADRPLRPSENVSVPCGHVPILHHTYILTRLLCLYLVMQHACTWYSINKPILVLVLVLVIWAWCAPIIHGGVA